MAYQPPDNLPPPLEAVTDVSAAYLALRERVRQTEEEIARISSILSHDLRAQLRSVDAFREFVREDAADGLDDESCDNLDRIGQTVRSLDHLVQRVVLLQRLPRQPLQLTTVSLAQVIEPVLRRVRDELPRATVVIEGDEGASARADAPRASEALYQLIENAAVFVPRESVDAPVATLVIATGASGERVLRVVDRGIGIEPEDHARIFELGRRLHGPRTYPGAGVGLYLARRLLEGWARGPVLVASAPGAGSTFEMELPGA